MTKVVVFGPTGQVGWEMVRSLQGFGHVRAVDRAEVDLADPPRVSALIDSLKPQWVVNCAAYTQVDAAEAEPERAKLINADAVGAMATACARIDATLVHYSTDYVFDGTKSTAYNENDSARPLGAYGRSKLLSEEAIRASGASHLILRASWIYAARGINFLQTMLRLAHERDELQVVDDQFGAPTWARFVAVATTSMMWQTGRDASAKKRVRSGATVHLSNEGSTSWHGFATEIFTLMSAGGARVPRILPVSTEQYGTRARRPRNSQLDISLLKRQWGVEPPNWRASLRMCLEEVTLLQQNCQIK
ncbi:MAG: dTDP-4-dehydrorhamnose reductase [Burkholderiaceae bacterium]